MKTRTKNKISKITLVIVLMATLTPIWIVGADTEPNNGIDNAEMIEAGISEGMITEQDRDFYVFYPAGQSDLTIMVHPSYELTMSATLYDADENVVTEQTTTNPGDIMTIYLDNVPESMYYLEVYSPQANESGEYTIDIQEKLVLSVLTIKVVDTNDSPIDGAEVYSIEAPTGQVDLSQLTDINGEATFSELESGEYTFVIEKTGYLNETIGQTFESAGNSTITVTLQNEPDVPAEQGGFVERNMTGIGLLALAVALIAAGWWYYNSNKQEVPPIEQQ